MSIGVGRELDKTWHTVFKCTLTFSNLFTVKLSVVCPNLTRRIRNGSHYFQNPDGSLAWYNPRYPHAPWTRRFKGAEKLHWPNPQSNCVANVNPSKKKTAKVKAAKSISQPENVSREKGSLKLVSNLRRRVTRQENTARWCKRRGPNMRPENRRSRGRSDLQRTTLNPVKLPHKIHHPRSRQMKSHRGQKRDPGRNGLPREPQRKTSSPTKRRAWSR